MNNKLVMISGEVVPLERAVVSVFDRGFLYGDSVFETVRTYGGKPFALDEHLERLARSASLVAIELPVDLPTLASEVRRAVAEASNPESYVRIMVTRGSGELGLDNALFETSDIHLHVPAGAVPKDGPSAGVAMVTSLASLLTGRSAPPDVAMTGEITLRGKVLPVGGIKEKLLAAKRAGIRRVLLPDRNRRDVLEIPPDLLKGLELDYVGTVDEVLDRALVPQA